MEKLSDLELDLSVQKHIFVVEDEEGTRIFITRILEKDNYKVTSFDSGKSFIHFLKTSGVKPDLILLDFTLGDITGLDCLKHIKSDSRLSHISVVMLTGEKKNELVKESYMSGAADYIIKPIVPNLLLERVRFNLTLKFETNEIYELLSHLHQEDQNLLNHSGLKEYFKQDARCYPILYKSNKLCCVFSKEYKPRAFIGATPEFLNAHLKIFMRNTVRWNQIWPPRMVQDEKNIDDIISQKKMNEIDNDKSQKVSYSNPLNDFNIFIFTQKTISELKKESLGKIPSLSLTLWKSIFKWSEEKPTCEKEIETLKDKARILSEIRGLRQ